MTTEDNIKLLQVIVSLVQALSGPVVTLFVLVYFGEPLKKFLSNLSEFSFKAGAAGVEASAKRQIEAGVLLGAAVAIKSGESPNAGQLPDAKKAQEIATVVSQAVKPVAASRLARASVLWVDDHPTDITHERKSMEALGIQFTMCVSTEEALEKLRLYPYDVIISDMRRAPDLQAGYTLLEATQRLGVSTPFIIYGGSSNPTFKAEARRLGAFGCTNDPQELFSLVITTIQNG